MPDLEYGSEGEPRKQACPSCGFSLDAFHESKGRLGCPRDYDVFREVVLHIMDSHQHDLLHVGKKPRRWDARHALDKLEKQLKNAIRREDYEAAAELKQQLEAMTSGDGADH